MIAHILLLPHPEHRERLVVRPGAPVWIGRDWDDPAEFGWTVDPATRANDDSDDPDESDDRPRTRVAWPSVGVTSAVTSALHLVLARDGAVVDEGSDRLGRVLGIGSEGVEDRVRAILAGKPIGTFAAAGTLVLLDADGKVIDV